MKYNGCLRGTVLTDYSDSLCVFGPWICLFLQGTRIGGPTLTPNPHRLLPRVDCTYRTFVDSSESFPLKTLVSYTGNLMEGRG